MFFTSTWSTASCDYPQLSPTVPHTSGYLTVPLDYSGKVSGQIELYWEKFPATQGPSKGDVFLLMGGPMPHFLMHGANGDAFYIPGLFSEYNLYFYDYRGFNCSSQKQSAEALKDIAQFYDTETFARDFVTLKNHLVGAANKVIIFGGSFGGMLGSQILNDFPEHIERAILYSSDLDSDFFYRSMAQADYLVKNTLSKQYPAFQEDWKKFLVLLENGKIVLFPGTPQEFKLTMDLVEVYFWMLMQKVEEIQGAPAQSTFVAAVSEAVKGISKKWEAFHQNLSVQLSPLKPEPPPTLQSSVLPFYECNVLFPFSTRKKLEREPLYFGEFSTRGLVKTLNQICQEYDALPERPFNITNKVRPQNIPILFWVGDRDWFDPNRATQNMRQFGPRVETHIMQGWAHDFGPNSLTEGLSTVRKMVNDFLTK